jgi:hypothetical protein
MLRDTDSRGRVAQGRFNWEEGNERANEEGVLLTVEFLRGYRTRRAVNKKASER